MDNQKISFANEIFRKMIHIFSLVIPICYFFASELAILLILVPVTAIVVAIDAAKNHVKEIGDIYYKLFGDILRSEEKKGLSGASYTLLASCICILLFPKAIAVTAMAVPAVADAAAGIVGRKFGKMKFFSKTVEGTLAFIGSGIFIVYMVVLAFRLDLLFFVTGFVAVCIAAVIEASSKYLHIDDNFSLPLVIGFFMGVLL